MSVKNKTIDKYNYNDFNLTLDSGYSINKIALPSKSKETETIEGSVDEIVSQLTDILKNKIKVI
jgi:electron transfer flavoprotein alpha/beta subunit